MPAQLGPLNNYLYDELIGFKCSVSCREIAVRRLGCICAFGNAVGNSIVSGLSTKSNQSGQLSPQTQRELAQAEKSGVVSPELARKVMQETGQSLGGLSVGLDGNKLLVGDGSTDWRGDLSQMDN